MSNMQFQISGPSKLCREIEESAERTAARELYIRTQVGIARIDKVLQRSPNTGQRRTTSPPICTGPVELRSAVVDDVNYAKRIITVIAAPYDSPALVEYRGATWTEIFERGAFSGANPVRVNRGHDKARTVGRVAQFPRGHSVNGLVADCRIAKTVLGDETLALADEECLSASVGYAVLGPDGQRLDTRSMTRRINKAWLDHLAFVESPAYTDARVLRVT